MIERIKSVFRSLNRQKWWVVAYGLALAIRVVLAVPLVHDWDGFVMTESAKNMLEGVTPYMTVESNDPTIYPDSDRPMTEQWLGYPPLPLIMFTIPYALVVFSGVQMTPVLESFIIKTPFIFGDLLCAYLVLKFLAKKSKRLANRASLLVLFNPLFIWVSSAWGMFDLWLINLLLLFLLSLRSKRLVLAGVFLGLAPQVKLFPLFFMPIIFLYICQIVKQKSQRIKLFLSFVLTTVAIDAPFFLSSPQGFMNQNLVMHWYRPPQGVGVVAIIDFLSHIYRFDASIAGVAAFILTISLILLFNLLALAYVQGKESRLLTNILLIYTSTLVFNKVVNEQYFVVLVGLLIVLTHLPRETQLVGRRFLVWLETIATFSVLFVGVLLGFHFLTFLPPFLANGYFKASTNYLVYYLSSLVPQLPLYTYPNSLWTYYNAPVAVAYLVLIPLLLSCTYLVARGLLEVFRRHNDVVRAVASYLILPKPNLLTAAVFLLSFATTAVLTPPALAYLQESKAFVLVDLVEAGETSKRPPLPKQPRVGTFYNVWWNNPSHRKDLADDAWEKTTLTPEVGYYTSKNSYFVRHIRQMKDAGIDFAIISYHLYDRERYLTFGKYAEKLGFLYAPLIETVDILGSERFRPVDRSGTKFLGFSLSEDSRIELENVIDSSLSENSKSPALLRISGKPVLYIYDGHWFFPSWDQTSKKKLAQRILSLYRTQGDDPYDEISKNWNTFVRTEEDLLAYYPKDIFSFSDHTPSAQDYRLAFLLEYESFWEQIRASLEKKFGPLYILSTYTSPVPEGRAFVIKPGDFTALSAFDNEFFYSLSNTWVNWRNVAKHEEIMDVWEKQEQEQAERDKKNRWPVFLTVTPAYKDTIVRGELGFEIPAKVNGKSIYDWTWEIVIKNKADFVLVATWNEFFEGTAIEPTKEYGSYYLQETKRWTERFKQITSAQLHNENN